MSKTKPEPTKGTELQTYVVTSPQQERRTSGNLHIPKTGTTESLPPKDHNPITSYIPPSRLELTRTDWFKALHRPEEQLIFLQNDYDESPVGSGQLTPIEPTGTTDGALFEMDDDPSAPKVAGDLPKSNDTK